ncbi:MAG TPA: methyltransferase domain-containing protein [Chloroflexota bacterium]|nr:methyltransferase domain-containing protein [Chloroflexota bacterium]
MTSLSPELRAFVARNPLMRRSILRFVQDAARCLPPGSRVLDVGAAEAPYRELFAHCEYVTADLAATEYHDFSAHPPDIVCDITAIPLPDASQDAILCTEVLEHVPEPDVALSEFRRLLVPGGHLFVTTPFVWFLHEQPYDFYRYTPFSLERLLVDAGFQDVSILPRERDITTLVMLLERYTYVAGWTRKPVRRRVRHLILKVLHEVVRGNRLYAGGLQPLLPVGYAAHCIAPAGDVLSVLNRPPCDEKSRLPKSTPTP